MEFIKKMSHHHRRGNGKYHVNTKPCESGLVFFTVTEVSPARIVCDVTSVRPRSGQVLKRGQCILPPKLPQGSLRLIEDRGGNPSVRIMQDDKLPALGVSGLVSGGCYVAFVKVMKSLTHGHVTTVVGFVTEEAFSAFERENLPQHARAIMDSDNAANNADSGTRTHLSVHKPSSSQRQVRQPTQSDAVVVRDTNPGSKYGRVERFMEKFGTELPRRTKI